MIQQDQLAFRFEHRPALTGEDLLIADNNREAVGWIDRWRDWRNTALALYGPAGCGKTHLAQVFLAASCGRELEPADLASGEPPHLLKDVSTCVLEDAERFVEVGLENALLHLYNTVNETGRRMLLTARRPPSHWPIRLPDLRSRLNAATAVGIGPPDDALIKAVLVKLFMDRQLRVDEEVVAFMLTRMERSFEAARDLVARLDTAALNAHRNITVPFVREVLKARE